MTDRTNSSYFILALINRATIRISAVLAVEGRSDDLPVVAVEGRSQDPPIMVVEGRSQIGRWRKRNIC